MGINRLTYYYCRFFDTARRLEALRSSVVEHEEYVNRLTAYVSDRASRIDLFASELTKQEQRWKQKCTSLAEFKHVIESVSSSLCVRYKSIGFNAKADPEYFKLLQSLYNYTAEYNEQLKDHELLKAQYKGLDGLSDDLLEKRNLLRQLQGELDADRIKLIEARIKLGNLEFQLHELENQAQQKCVPMLAIACAKL